MAFLLTFSGGGSLTYKDAVRVASTAALSSLSGVGTHPLSIDGTPLANNDRVLLKNQGDAPVSAGAQNGIYVYKVTGADWTLTRALDCDTDKEVLTGMLVPVSEGATYADKNFQLITNAPIVVGTTALVFVDALTVGLATKANRDLSNLTSPTAINQSLLFSDDVSFNIGAAAASRPQTVYVKTAVNLASLTASRILSADASKNIVSLDTTTYPSLTELAYVKGVTSALQTQLNAKVDSVGASAPLSSSGGTSPSISISQASAMSDGYLSSVDWSTFNAKQNALTFGNLTGDNNANISISSGTGAVIGTGTSISQSAASAMSNGYLKSTDWSTFNSKQNALTIGNLTSSDITVSGGTGAVIGSGVSLSITKGNLSESTSSVLTISNGTNAVFGSGTTIQVKQASALQSGYLSSGDWSTFNNKQPAGNYITALTGEVTATGGGSVAATISNSAVTNAKLADMANATIKGNNSGISAAPSDLSVTTVTSMLNVMGAASSSAGGLKGLVPATAAGDQTKYLRGDATWATVDLSTKADTNLGNLTAPTAVNQNLNILMATPPTARINTQQAAPYGIGINAVTPSNAGTLTLTMASSVTGLVKVGDVVYLNGLEGRLSQVNAISGNGLTVTVNTLLGEGGSGNSRELYIVPSGLTISPSTGAAGISLFNYIFNGALIPHIYFPHAAKQMIIGSHRGTLRSDGSNIFIGFNSGIGSSNSFSSIAIGNDTTIGGVSGGCIALGHSSTAQQNGVAVGGSASNSGQNTIAIGSSAASATSSVALGASTNAASNGIAIGYSATNNSQQNLMSIGSSNTIIYWSLLGQGYSSITAPESAKYTILTTTPTSGTNISAQLAELAIHGASATGNALSGSISLKLSTPTSSGTTVQTPREMMRLDAVEAQVGVMNKMQLFDSARINSGDVEIETVGKGLKVKTGTNATAGTATILNGNTSVTVTTSAASTNSLILVTNQTSTAAMCVTTKAAGSFNIEHANPVSGDQTVAWFIINPVSFDADAQAFITAVGTLTEAQQEAINKFVKKLKAQGLWNRMVAIYPFVGGTATTNSYNLKNAAQYQITWNGTVTHNANGITGDGTSGYGNLNFNPSAITNTNSVHICVYSRSNSLTTNACEFGSENAAGAQAWSATLFDSSAGNGTNFNMQGVNLNGFVIGSSLGLNTATRYGTGGNVFRNKYTGPFLPPTLSPGTPSATPNTNNFYILAKNANGTATNFSPRNLAYFSVGSGLTPYDLISYYDAIQELQTSFGRQV
jgi:hypothetical protein